MIPTAIIATLGMARYFVGSTLVVSGGAAVVVVIKDLMTFDGAGFSFPSAALVSAVSLGECTF